MRISISISLIVESIIIKMMQMGFKFVLLVLCVSLDKSDNGKSCYKLGDKCGESELTCNGIDYHFRNNKCDDGGGIFRCPHVKDDDGFLLCKHAYFHGDCKSYSMKEKDCVNIDKDNNDWANSIHTMG